MRTITVDLGERSYPIYIGHPILNALADICTLHALPHRIAIITDKGVAPLYLREITNILEHHGFETIAITIPSGERQKSLTRANTIFTELLEHRLKRDSAIMAFGGGVVGDLTGFIAATYRRGIPFIQAPTTLLGQVESSVGGKVGINISGTKNAAGAFYQPKFVFSDVNLLSTLPRREIICGIGEILKYGYLSEEMFSFLDANIERILGKDLSVIEETIIRCNEMKARMISEDEREMAPNGGRIVLNLGHTIGHALENLSNYSLHHGEAVVVGLKWELALAKEAGIVDAGTFEKIHSLLSRVNFNPRMDFLTQPKLVKSICGKNTTAKFILPKGIGKIETVEIESSLFKKVIKNKKAGD
jgi:3-dehydroquinate synthase